MAFGLAVLPSRLSLASLAGRPRQHANLLQKFGLNPADLLGGGKGLGGVLGN